MTGCDFDWMASNHAVWGWKATVKASVSGVSFLQLSPFFVSIFPLFPHKRLILRLVGSARIFFRAACVTDWFAEIFLNIGLVCSFFVRSVSISNKRCLGAPQKALQSGIFKIFLAVFFFPFQWMRGIISKTAVTKNSFSRLKLQIYISVINTFTKKNKFRRSKLILKP